MILSLVIVEPKRKAQTKQGFEIKIFLTYCRMTLVGLNMDNHIKYKDKHDKVFLFIDVKH